MTQERQDPPRALVIGLGAMGAAILQRLHSQGWDVAGVDPDFSALQRLRGLGFHVSERLTEVPTGFVGGCCLLTSLPDDKTVQAVVEQILELPVRARPALFVETSTILPSTIQAVEERLRAVAPVIDIAVSGGPDQVFSGTLISYVAGDEETRVPLLSKLLIDLCDRVVACPRLGDAKLVKILNNTMGWAATVVGAEVVAAGVASGLDRAWLVAALSTGNGRSHQFVKRFQRLVDGDQATYFSLAMGQKDARLGLALAQELQAPARMTEALHASLAEVKNVELLGADIVAYYKHYESLIPNPRNNETTTTTTTTKEH